MNETKRTFVPGRKFWALTDIPRGVKSIKELKNIGPEDLLKKYRSQYQIKEDYKI
jgi:hypothetical protein